MRGISNISYQNTLTKTKMENLQNENQNDMMSLFVDFAPPRKESGPRGPRGPRGSKFNTLAHIRVFANDRVVLGNDFIEKYKMEYKTNLQEDDRVSNGLDFISPRNFQHINADARKRYDKIFICVCSKANKKVDAFAVCHFVNDLDVQKDPEKYTENMIGEPKASIIGQVQKVEGLVDMLNEVYGFTEEDWKKGYIDFNVDDNFIMPVPSSEKWYIEKTVGRGPNKGESAFVSRNASDSVILQLLPVFNAEEVIEADSDYNEEEYEYNDEDVEQEEKMDADLSEDEMTDEDSE